MTFLKEFAGKLVSRTDFGKKLVRAYNLSKYLEKTGWFRSCEEKLPVDQNGKCIPWYTYPALSFLMGRLHPEMTVFEYGSGNSTLWWSRHVSSVISCEHDLKWFNLLKEKVPSNVEYLHCKLEYGGEYCKIIQRYKNRFGCIIIDGRDRVNCARNSLAALKADGVILWDNSNRKKYQEGFSFLAESGFRRLDFWGIGPIDFCEWCTSIFYRDGNCLNI